MSQTQTWRIVIGVREIRRSKDGRYAALGLGELRKLSTATATFERLEADEFCVIAETAQAVKLAEDFLNRHGQRYPVCHMDLNEALATFGVDDVSRAYQSAGGWVCRPGKLFSSAGNSWRERLKRWFRRRQLRVVVGQM